MKRQWKIALCLMMSLAALSSCSGGGSTQGGSNPAVYAQVTQYLGPTPTDTPVPAQPDPQSADSSIFSVNPYDAPADFTQDDAINEENYIDSGIYGDPNDAGALMAQAAETVYPYAGSTPIPLNPVDMPSPTPHPALSFTYVAYTAGSLGLTFEAPSGWLADDSQTEVFTVTEPETQMKDGQQCVITISAVPVNNNYSERDLKNEVTKRLKDISAVNFAVWDPSLTATRYLMGSKGVYANYTGKLVNGIELAGRIHYVCVENMLYGVELVFPRAYREDYLNVFSQVRETIKRQ